VIGRIILLVIVFFIPLSSTYAHDFDTIAFSYILSNPDASYSDFENYLRDSGDITAVEQLQNIETKLSSVLALPGKKYVVNYARENPDFTYGDIKKLIGDDPMLSEIGSEVIYSFLHTSLQTEKNFMSFDFFIRTIYL